MFGAQVTELSLDLRLGLRTVCVVLCGGGKEARLFLLGVGVSMAMCRTEVVECWDVVGQGGPTLVREDIVYVRTSDSFDSQHRNLNVYIAHQTMYSQVHVSLGSNND